MQKLHFSKRNNFIQTSGKIPYLKTVQINNCVRFVDANNSKQIYVILITSKGTSREGRIMLDNTVAIKLESYEERKAEIIIRLNDYLNEDLLSIYREAMCYDGSFDFCDAFDLEELIGMVDNKYELVRSIIYGDVKSIDGMVRYNAYGNLESVTEYDLQWECEDYIDDLAEWLMDNYDHVSGLYEDDKELFEAWWDIDHDQYDWDEEEEE